jgi:hypothetical protein
MKVPPKKLSRPIKNSIPNYKRRLPLPVATPNLMILQFLNKNLSRRPLSKKLNPHLMKNLLKKSSP